jgi:hypothetical protein
LKGKGVWNVSDADAVPFHEHADDVEPVGFVGAAMAVDPDVSRTR